MSESSSAVWKPRDCLRTRVCAYARDTCASTRKRVHREDELITCLTPPAGLGALGPQTRRLQPPKPSDSQIPCGCPAATALAPQVRSRFCLCAATLPRPQTPLPVRAHAAVTIVASALGAASAAPDMHAHATARACHREARRTDVAARHPDAQGNAAAVSRRVPCAGRRALNFDGEPRRRCLQQRAGCR